MQSGTVPQGVLGILQLASSNSSGQYSVVLQQYHISIALALYVWNCFEDLLWGKSVTYSIVSQQGHSTGNLKYFHMKDKDQIILHMKYHKDVLALQGVQGPVSI